MSVFEQATEALQTLQILPESERSEYFDSLVTPLVDQAAAIVRQRQDQEHIGHWLFVQSAAFGLAVEGIPETTLELSEAAPSEFQAAVAALPGAQRFRIELLLKEFRGEETVPQEILAREGARAASRLRELRSVLAASRSVTRTFGEFIGESTFTSVRGFPVVKGTFTLFDRNGGQIDAYPANDGGGARTFRNTNGPTPPGLYRVSNHRPNRTTTGMVLNGVGYSFDVDPTGGTEVFGRSLFRIHPDGGSPQTNGCIGIRENASRLRACEQQIVDLLDSNGAFNISIIYEGLNVG